MAGGGEPPVFSASDEAAFEALLRWRRDVRHFRRDPLDEAEVERLLRLAHYSPSVGLSQPWRFVRVRSPELREDLAAHVDAEVERAGERYAKERRDLYRTLKLHGLREAPEIIAVCCDEATETGHRLGAVTMPEARRYSCVLAVHTMWLAARMRGIGLGWVSIFDPDVVAERLRLPEAWHCLSLLCIGWPEETSLQPELEKRGWESRLDWRDNVSER